MNKMSSGQGKIEHFQTIKFSLHLREINVKPLKLKQIQTLKTQMKMIDQRKNKHKMPYPSHMKSSLK